jgi:hypothetical protein
MSNANPRPDAGSDPGTDAEAVQEWTIKHVKEQLYDYDFFTLLTYVAKDVKMRGPGVTRARTADEEEWRADFDTVEPSEEPVFRAHLTPRLTGSASQFRVQISWTDPDGGRHSGWYEIPHPGRKNPKLKFG